MSTENNLKEQVARAVLYYLEGHASIKSKAAGSTQGMDFARQTERERTKM
jgi:hypothetical protein